MLTLLLLSSAINVANTPLQTTNVAPATQHETGRGIAAALNDLTANDQKVAAAAAERLRELPGVPVIVELGKALRDNPAFEEPLARDRAYGVLAFHRAA